MTESARTPFTSGFEVGRAGLEPATNGLRVQTCGDTKQVLGHAVGDFFNRWRAFAFTYSRLSRSGTYPLRPDQHRNARSAWCGVEAMKFSRISATAIGASACGKCPTPSSTSRRLPARALWAAYACQAGMIRSRSPQIRRVGRSAVR